MALPKEPRQQMINMMYLVLIALLAMNVSADILKAFRLVQVSLDKSNNAALLKADDLWAKMELQYKNDPVKAKDFHSKAKNVRKNCKELVDLIVEVKSTIEKKGSKDQVSGKAAYTDQGHGVPELAQASNQEIGSEILIFRKQGDRLRDKINATVESLMFIVDEKERESFTFALERAEDVQTSDGKKNWAADKFESMPLAAVVTMLSKFEADVRATEIDMLSYLLSKIGVDDIAFDVLESQVIPQSSYITLGEDYKAQIFVSAYSSTQDPLILIGKLDESKLTPTDSSGTMFEAIVVPEGGETPMLSVTDTLKVKNGKGIFKVSPNGIGPQEYEGVIRLRKPTGGFKFFPFKAEYAVGKGGVVVSPDKMNVLYIGVDNPISISVPGFAPDKVKGSITQGSLRAGGKKGSYVAKVTRPGDANILVSVITPDGKSKQMGKAPFRVKRVPDPTAKVGGQSGGNIKTAKFKAQRGIIADLENFDFDIRFRIVSYELIYRAPRQDLITAQGKGQSFDQRALNLIKRAKPGDSFVFNSIRAKGPDGTTRKLPAISFELK